LGAAASQAVNGGHGPQGQARGVSGKEVVGKRAKWIDDWGEIEGQTVGIAIFDHPDNY
jgi:hypothetical protein